MHKFSIVTVTYNAGNYIRSTLESIKKQIFIDYELIVIDGNSKDNTQNIIDEYNDYVSIRISEKDEGIYDAMNKGIDYANSEYCMFLNAGDELNKPDSLLQAYYRIIDSCNKDIYIGDAEYDYGNKQIYYTPQLKKLPFRFCHQSMFFKTSLLKKEKYNISYKFSGDSELFYRLLEKGVSIERIEIPIVKEHAGDGVTERNLYKSAKELFSIPYLRNNLTTLYIYYRLFKIRVYCLIKKITNYD